jgi:hypothetical protein
VRPSKLRPKSYFTQPRWGWRFLWPLPTHHPPAAIPNRPLESIRPLWSNHLLLRWGASARGHWQALPPNLLHLWGKNNHSSWGEQKFLVVKDRKIIEAWLILKGPLYLADPREPDLGTEGEAKNWVRTFYHYPGHRTRHLHWLRQHSLARRGRQQLKQQQRKIWLELALRGCRRRSVRHWRAGRRRRLRQRRRLGHRAAQLRRWRLLGAPTRWRRGLVGFRRYP